RRISSSGATSARTRRGTRMSRRNGEGRRAAAGVALAIVVAAFALPAAADEVEYFATTDRDRIALDETLTLHVRLSTSSDDEVGEVELPETPDFDLVSTGRSSQSAF